MEVDKYKDQIRVSAFKILPLENLIKDPKDLPITVRIHFDKVSVPGQVRSILEENTRELPNYQWSRIVFSPFCEEIKEELAINIAGTYKMNKKVKQAIKSLEGVIKVSPMD